MQAAVGWSPRPSAVDSVEMAQFLNLLHAGGFEGNPKR
jgi:hypothetical protein